MAEVLLHYYNASRTLIQIKLLVNLQYMFDAMVKSCAFIDAESY